MSLSVESDYEDSGTCWDELIENDLEEIHSHTQVSTGIRTSYAPHWSEQEAFREFYQNW